MQKQDYVRIGKKITSEIMKNSYLIKPYVPDQHYKRAKMVVAALNFVFRYLDQGD